MGGDDLGLLRRYVDAQDPEAFSELIRRHAGMVYGVARRVVRDHSDAEDVVQETFIELIRHAAQLRAPLTAWLHTAAYHRALDLCRNQRRRARNDHQLAAPAAAPPADPGWQEMLQRVDAVLDQLPVSVRAPVLLHYFEGRTHEQIAEELGIAPRTVSARIESGLKRMRQGLRVGDRSLPALAGALLGQGALPLPDALRIRMIKLGLSGWTAPASVAGAGAGVAWWGVGLAAAGLAATASVWGVQELHQGAAAPGASRVQPSVAEGMAVPAPAPLATPATSLDPAAPPAAAAAGPPPGPGWSETFSDDFTGSSLDPGRWISPANLGRRYAGDHPGHDAGHEWLRDPGPERLHARAVARAAWVAGDGLHLCVDRLADPRRPDGSVLCTARIASRFAQRMGWFEVDCRPPRAAHITTTISLVQAPGAWPADLQIMQFNGTDDAAGGVFQAMFLPDKALTARHGALADAQRVTRQWDGSTLSDGFHRFAVEWSAEGFRWYLDGASQPLLDCPEAAESMPAQPMFLMLAIEPGSGLLATDAAAMALPQACVVRAVHVYERQPPAPPPP